jgi:hypothetical protein
VTLLEMRELRRLAITELGAEIERRGMDWLHLPIADGDTPGWRVRSALAGCEP